MRGIRSFAKHETEEVLAIRRGDKQRKGNVTMRRKLIACGLLAALILTGTVSAVEASFEAIATYVRDKLGFTVCAVTRT